MKLQFNVAEMISALLSFAFLWVMCSAETDDQPLLHVSRTTLSDIQTYRSALTLDWLAAEDKRQGNIVTVVEDVKPTPILDAASSDCNVHARPSAIKVSKLMLEVMKNLEGDDGPLIPSILQALIISQLLFDSDQFDVEPDLDSLIKTPKLMSGEPHKTLPRIVSLIWLTVTEPSIVKQHGWCLMKKVSKYLRTTGTPEIANRMRSVQPLLANIRFTMEEFIRKVKPLYPRRRTFVANATLRDKGLSDSNYRKQMLYLHRNSDLQLTQNGDSFQSTQLGYGWQITHARHHSTTDLQYYSKYRTRSTLDPGQQGRLPFWNPSESAPENPLPETPEPRAHLSHWDQVLNPYDVPPSYEPKTWSPLKARPEFSPRAYRSEEQSFNHVCKSKLSLLVLCPVVFLLLY